MSPNYSEGLLVVWPIFKTALIGGSGPHKSDKTSDEGHKNGHHDRYYSASALHRNTDFIKESSTAYKKSKRLTTLPSSTFFAATPPENNQSIPTTPPRD